jgi:hypothetical protein
MSRTLYTDKAFTRCLQAAAEFRGKMSLDVARRILAAEDLNETPERMAALGCTPSTRAPKSARPVVRSKSDTEDKPAPKIRRRRKATK